MRGSIKGGRGIGWNFSATLLQYKKDSHRFLAATDTKIYWYKYIKVAPGYLAERDDSMADLENMLSGTGKNLRSLQIDTSARLL